MQRSSCWEPLVWLHETPGLRTPSSAILRGKGEKYAEMQLMSMRPDWTLCDSPLPFAFPEISTGWKRTLRCAFPTVMEIPQLLIDIEVQVKPDEIIVRPSMQEVVMPPLCGSQVPAKRTTSTRLVSARMSRILFSPLACKGLYPAVRRGNMKRATSNNSIIMAETELQRRDTLPC